MRTAFGYQLVLLVGVASTGCDNRVTDTPVPRHEANVVTVVGREHMAEVGDTVVFAGIAESSDFLTYTDHVAIDTAVWSVDRPDVARIALISTRDPGSAPNPIDLTGNSYALVVALAPGTAQIGANLYHAATSLSSPDYLSVIPRIASFDIAVSRTDMSVGDTATVRFIATYANGSASEYAKSAIAGEGECHFRQEASGGDIRVIGVEPCSVRLTLTLLRRSITRTISIRAASQGSGVSRPREED